MSVLQRTTMAFTDGGNRFGSYFENEPDYGLYFSHPIPAGSVDLAFACAIDVSEMTNYLLLADGDTTIKTNDPDSPDAMIELKAGVPLVWNFQGGYQSAPSAAFGATDVTSIYVTSATGGRLSIAVGGAPAHAGQLLYGDDGDFISYRVNPLAYA